MNYYLLGLIINNFFWLYFLTLKIFISRVKIIKYHEILIWPFNKNIYSYTSIFGYVSFFSNFYLSLPNILEINLILQICSNFLAISLFLAQSIVLLPASYLLLHNLWWVSVPLYLFPLSPSFFVSIARKVTRGSWKWFLQIWMPHIEPMGMMLCQLDLRNTWWMLLSKPHELFSWTRGDHKLHISPWTSNTTMLWANTLSHSLTNSPIDH